MSLRDLLSVRASSARLIPSRNFRNNVCIISDFLLLNSWEVHQYSLMTERGIVTWILSHFFIRSCDFWLTMLGPYKALEDETSDTNWGWKTCHWKLCWLDCSYNERKLVKILFLFRARKKLTQIVFLNYLSVHTT